MIAAGKVLAGQFHLSPNLGLGQRPLVAGHRFHLPRIQLEEVELGQHDVGARGQTGQERSDGLFGPGRRRGADDHGVVARAPGIVDGVHEVAVGGGVALVDGRVERGVEREQGPIVDHVAQQNGARGRPTGLRWPPPPG